MSCVKTDFCAAPLPMACETWARLVTLTTWHDMLYLHIALYLHDNRCARACVRAHKQMRAHTHAQCEGRLLQNFYPMFEAASASVTHRVTVWAPKVQSSSRVEMLKFCDAFEILRTRLRDCAKCPVKRSIYLSFVFLLRQLSLKS